MKKYVYVLAAVMALCLLLTGCTQTNLVQGEWVDERTFENAWAHVRLQLPEDSGLTVNEELKDSITPSYPTTTYYEFVVSDMDRERILVLTYENVAKFVEKEGLTQDSYINDLRNSILETDEATYEIGEPYTVTLGGYDYAALDMTVDGGAAYQTSLVRLQEEDGVLVCWSVTGASEAQLQEMMELLATVEGDW